MRILMVDDEPYMLWLYEDLEARGHKVTWAHGEMEARKHIEDQSFDLAIVDVLMPAPPESPDPEGASQVLGLKLCKDILKTDWGKSGRVIVLSVLTHAEFLQRAEQVDLDPESIGFYSKEPFPDLMNILNIGLSENSAGLSTLDES